MPFQLGELINKTAEAFFVGGLVAACASSALTVAMGAALACQSLLSGGEAANAMAIEALQEVHESSASGSLGREVYTHDTILVRIQQCIP